MEEIVSQYISGDYEIFRREIGVDIPKSIEFERELIKQVESKRKKKYFYLITFTLRDDILEKDEELVEQYIISQFKRKALKIVNAEIVKEKTKQGRPHWHVSVASNKFIAKNRFNYYTKKYGFIDISKSTDKTQEESLNYINKENVSTKIL